MTRRSPIPLPLLGALGLSTTGCAETPIVGQWIMSSFDGQEVPYVYQYSYTYNGQTVEYTYRISAHMRIFSDMTGYLQYDLDFRILVDGRTVRQFGYGDADLLRVTPSSRRSYAIEIPGDEREIRCMRDGGHLSCRETSGDTDFSFGFDRNTFGLDDIRGG